MMNQAFRVNHPQVVCETIEGEVVIVNLETGSYYSLLNSGAAVWSGIERQTDCEVLIEEIIQSHEGNPEEISAAVYEFLSKLQNENLIVSAPVATAESTVLAQAIVQSVNKPRFEKPLLEKFSDMEDLLLLDPIHEVDVQVGWPIAKA